MNLLRRTCLLVLAPALAMGDAAAAGGVALTVHLGRPAGDTAPLLFGEALPASGSPGAEGLLAQLLPNRSFELTPPGEPVPIPEAWGEAEGWELRACGPRHVLVRRALGSEGALVLAGRKRWATYRLTALARKIDGPGGLGVLFEVQSRTSYLRWTLGADGNRHHVLERVRAGRAERVVPPVVGRIEAGRLYKLEVVRSSRVVRCMLNGRLIHRVADRVPSAGVGLCAADATAEYFDVAAYVADGTPRFLLDDPAKATRDSISAGWEARCDPRNAVAFKWDSLYPFNSHFSQSIKVAKYEGGDAGLVRHGVPVAAGAAYRGRVHLRAQGKAPVAVSLRGRGGQVYASQTVGEPGEAWRAFDFVLTPRKADPAADFCVTVGGAATVWVDEVSLAPAEAGPGGLRREAAEALRPKRPAVVRWPAGPGAAAYDWRSGVGPRDERPVEAVVGGREAVFQAAANDFGTGEFVTLCKAVGAEPLLVLSPAIGLGPAASWLEYCNGEANTVMGKLRAEHGRVEPYAVRLWAVGGVPVGDLDVAGYAGHAAALAHALHEQDPSVRTAALLFEPDAAHGLLAVEARGELPLRLHAAAARRGRDLLVRVVHLGDQALEASLTVDRLGGLRLGTEATLVRIDAQPAAAQPAEDRVAVAGNSLQLSLPPQATHILVLRLEGDPE